MALENISNVPEVCSGMLRIDPGALHIQIFFLLNYPQTPNRTDPPPPLGPSYFDQDEWFEHLSSSLKSPFLNILFGSRWIICTLFFNHLPLSPATPSTWCCPVVCSSPVFVEEIHSFTSHRHTSGKLDGTLIGCFIYVEFWPIASVCYHRSTRRPGHLVA